MSKVEASAVERIIANTINETARGDPDALAARIVAALAEAGYRILPPNGRENAAQCAHDRSANLLSAYEVSGGQNHPPSL